MHSKYELSNDELLGYAVCAYTYMLLFNAAQGYLFTSYYS